MNFYKPTLLFLLLTLLWNCASFKAKKQEALLDMPQLGTIVKTKGNILYNATEQIGVPNWQNLKVAVQELPFNLESYVSYAKHMQRAGKINTIPYNDSLRFKPKYVRLQLDNKVGLTQLLNNDSHREMRNYLSLDDNHRLVTTLDVALTETDIQIFLNATAAKLKKDKFNNIILSLTNKEEERAYILNDLPIFGYGLSAFCWGEDRYHNKRIQNIVSEEFKCPKNTYLDASKIKTDKAYLKF